MCRLISRKTHFQSVQAIGTTKVRGYPPQRSRHSPQPRRTIRSLPSTRSHPEPAPWSPPLPQPKYARSERRTLPLKCFQPCCNVPAKAGGNLTKPGSFSKSVHVRARITHHSLPQAHLPRARRRLFTEYWTIFRSPKTQTNEC